MAAPSPKAVFNAIWHSVRYEPGSGRFYRIFPKRPQRRITTRDIGGYITIRIAIGGRRWSFKAHRLAWLIMTGAWPEAEIDHRNGRRHDNRWKNLRPATRLQNCHNRGRNRGKRFKGIRKESGSGWAFRVHLNGVCHRRGGFRSAQEALAARAALARELHGDFARPV